MVLSEFLLLRKLRNMPLMRRCSARYICLSSVKLGAQLLAAPLSGEM